jgi:hypothetical protein
VFDDSDIIIARVKEALLSWKENWLMIFDNRHNLLVIEDIQTFSPEINQGSIAITTHHHDFMECFPVILVESMKDSEGLKLLLLSSPNTSKDIPVAKQFLISYVISHWSYTKYGHTFL